MLHSVCVLVYFALVFRGVLRGALSCTFDLKRMGDKSRRGQQEWMRRIANLFRERGSAEKRSGLLGAVPQTLGVSPTPTPLPDLHEPSVYIDSSAKAFDFAIFPQVSRLPLAAAAGDND